MRERDRLRIERVRHDQAVVHEAAARVRAAPAEGVLAGLTEPETAQGLAELLDVLADELDTVPTPIRDHAVRVCRELTDDTMDDPTRRRTRRR